METLKRKCLSDYRRVFEQTLPNFPKGTPFWEDTSFKDAANLNATIRQIGSLFPERLDNKLFSGQPQVESLGSSYMDHGYGLFFYALARVLKPELCMEVGVLHGFSLLHIASALRDNGVGNIQGFDLFEDYPYRHGSFTEVTKQIEELGLSDIATIDRSDAFEVHEPVDSIDMLHVDISNNGDTFRKTFDLWANKVTKAIVLEGGSQTRDQIDWMVEFSKPPIHVALEEIKVDYPQWSIFVFEPFPSVTVALLNK